MNKSILAVFGVLLFLGVGFYVYQSLQSGSSQVVSVQGIDLAKSITPIPTNESVTDTKSSSRYVPYTTSAFNVAASGRRVLFFYASWCPTCRPADADFVANQNKFPTDLTVLRVNYNDPDTDSEEKDLAKKYAVTYQHTFVQIDAKGEKVAVWNGGQTSELLEKIK
ncbi:thioredoxin family protein [Candidatus Woesebacteria bacterium]|nr:thioredoxin family protein [Candidatus Woesebacteria bacterium]